MNDLRFACRQLQKSPGFAAVAALTLALGIGANTAIFSVVDAVLLKPLSFPKSTRLVWMCERTSTSDSLPISFQDFKDWEVQQTVFEEVGVYNWGDYNLTGVGDPLRLRAAQMTGSAFKALQTKPTVGRVFNLNDDKPGAPRVAILSHGLWQDRFGGDPAIIMRSINLDGVSYEVVGVMPSSFVFPDPVDIWLPLGPISGEPGYQNRGNHPGLEGIARLKPGVSLARARAEFESIAQRLEQQYPDSNRDVRVRLDPLQNKVVGNISRALWTLLGAVAFVLLIACANVANLLLARAAARRKEMGLRTALGAGRWRIVRQLFIESILLAALGGGLGLLLARWALSLILFLSHNAVPRAGEIRMDGGVLIFTAVSALLTAVLFGLFPAWQTARNSLESVLKDSSRGSTVGHDRMRQGLIVAEVSLTLMLLIGAGLMLRSFYNLQTLNPGFSSERAMSFRVELQKRKYATLDQRDQFYHALVEKLQALPGVQAVGIGTRCPLEPFNELCGYQIEGQPVLPPDRRPTMDLSVASPNYFQAMGIRLLRGRTFTDQDNRERLRGSPQENDQDAGPNVIIIDEEFARRNWPNEDPLGKRVRLPWGEGDQNPVLTIVGIVARVKIRELSEHGGYPQAYLPAWQLPGTGGAVVVKTSVPPETLFGAVRDQVKSVDPVQPIFKLRTIEDLRSNSLAPQRLNLALFSLFGSVALALAAIGLYGVLSYSVIQRRREIGVRIALGARRSDVLGLVVTHGLKLVAGGIIIGLLGAWVLTRALESLIFEVHPIDPMTFSAVPVLLALVAFLACWLPAHRAASMEPMEALRTE